MAVAGGGWLASLKLRVKIIFWGYVGSLAACLIIAVVVYFATSAIPDIPNTLSKETMTTNGVYVLQKSYFMALEDYILGNLKSTLNSMRESIVKNELFRVTTVLVAVLATTLMGFTMIIGSQKLTVKEFMSDEAVCP